MNRLRCYKLADRRRLWITSAIPVNGRSEAQAAVSGSTQIVSFKDDMPTANPTSQPSPSGWKHKWRDGATSAVGQELPNSPHDRSLCAFCAHYPSIHLKVSITRRRDLSASVLAWSSLRRLLSTSALSWGTIPSSALATSPSSCSKTALRRARSVTNK